MSDKDKLDGVVRAYKAEFHRGLLAERELENLRREAAAMPIALQNVEYLEAQIASLRLTDEEREAVEQAAIRFDALCQIGAKDRAKTLRKLLKRLTGPTSGT